MKKFIMDILMHKILLDKFHRIHFKFYQNWKVLILL